MASKRSLTLLAALLTAVLLAGPAHAVEEILDWHSDILVNRDGSMVVSETIRVRAEGDQIRRGIYRDFPTIYKDRFGNKVVIDFGILSVKRDGQPESYHTENRSNGVRTYVGRQDVFLERGEYTYDITYRTDRQLGFFEDHDELYWNVTGNGWDFPILKASATVALPEAVPAQSLMMEGYTGPQGSREQALTWEVTGTGQVRFESTRILNRREGLTIVLGWPKGYVAEPGRGEKAARFLFDNTGVAIALGGFILLLLYYYWAWRKAGKDPERGTVIPRFEPPDDLSPAAMRYIMEMGFDNRAFASAIINLAVKGYITIHEEDGILGFGEVYTLKRAEGEPKVPLSRGEQKVARKLFPGNSKTLKLEKKNHQRVSGAIEALKDLLSADYQKAHFLNNKGYFGMGIVLSLCVLAAAAFSGGGTQTGPPPLFIIMWLTPWSVATFFLWATRRFLMAAVFTFFLVSASGMFAATASLTLVAGILAMVVLNILFYKLLKAPTNLGRRIMDRIEGFRMYLATAEEHRLEKLHPPEKTPELFERYLPYALALEVDQEWSEKFAGVLARAAAEEQYSPRWYHGHHWDGMHSGRFASSLGSSLSSAVSSASTAPGSSSGFGGGGGSGGGGGGGGGGGW
ncbi:MAG: DUF2207 domain-containing protein [bacterium]|nr:MAG: DUF2207 domain-containing protein [bacterium]